MIPRAMAEFDKGSRADIAREGGTFCFQVLDAGVVCERRIEEGLMGSRWSVGVLGVALLGFAVLPASADEQPVPRAVETHLSGSAQILFGGGAGGSGGVGGGQVDNHVCSTSGNPAANIDVSCDDPTSPDNETPIVSDPADPNHLLGGSNDYKIQIKGSTIQERVPTGFFVSFDGGHTWKDGSIPMGNGGSGGNGDPSPAFDDRFGTAHMAQLSAAQGQNGP